MNFSNILITGTCSEVGDTILTISADWLSPEQNNFKTVLKTYRATEPAAPPPQTIITGKGIQAATGIRGPATVKAADSSMFLVSNSPDTPPTPSVTLGPADQLFVTGLSSSGDSKLQITRQTSSSIDVAVRLYPSTLIVRGTSFGSLSPVGTREFILDTPNQQLMVMAVLVDPDSKSLIGLPSVRNFSTSYSLAAATTPFLADIKTSNPGIVATSLSQLSIGGGFQQATLDATALKTGETVISITQPPDFLDGPWSSLKVSVQTREVPFGPYLTVARGLQSLIGSTSVRNLTIESLAPDRLLLSNTPAALGSAKLTPTGQFYLQPSANVLPGERLAIRATADGFSTTDVPVLVGETYVSIFNFFPSSVGATDRTVTLLLRSAYVNTLLQNGVQPLPGVTFAAQLSSSDPSILDVASTRFVFDNLGRVEIPYRSFRPGTVTLTLSTEGPVTASNAPLRVTVPQ